jgi:hypothetical protein
MATDDRRYALFIQHANKSLWKGFFGDLEDAKQQAQSLADTEGCEYFVLDLPRAAEAFRALPLNTPKPN